MMTRIASAGVVMIAALASFQFVPCSRAQTGTASSVLKTEHRAVLFGADVNDNTKTLNELAAEGWEYVGPLANGMVAFQRRAVIAQRVRIVGTWEPVAQEAKGTVEFLKDGHIKLAGNTKALTALFDDVERLLETKGNLNALSYKLPEEGAFWLITDYSKLALAADDLKKFHAKGDFGGIPVGPSTAYAEIAVSERELTITRSGKAQSFKRVK
jgi:hypothetical protein